MINDIMADARERMHAAAESYKKELGSIRTGRASISMLDEIRVDMYGTMLPINQVATLSTPDARMIVIQPWDRGAIEAIEKAIKVSNLNLNPQNDGKLVRLPIPPLTEERRKDLVKQAKKKNEEAKVEVRGVRRDAKEMIEAAETEGEVSKDDSRRGLDDLQALTDTFAAKIDELTSAKEKEIMEF
ncbi:MAG: ribosome recycling factor [Candidatus Hydrogenedentota bacterium]